MRILLAIALVLSAPCQSIAWGFDAHRFIAEQMIALLPAELKPAFERRKAVISERSVDPDLWRDVWEDEAPNHFVDLDYYGAYPFTELPREYDRAVQKYGRDVIQEQGLLPWRTQEFYGRLQRAFESLKRPSPSSYVLDDITWYSAVLAHYVSDGHVPLHSVVNYDGQRTSQHGIHSRWEGDLFSRTRGRLKIAPKPIEPVKDPREFMFAVLLASHRLAPSVFEADKRAVAGRDFYDDAYFEMFAKDQLAILEQRLNESIAAVAAIVVGAWEQAGRPALTEDIAARKPRPVTRPPG